MTALGPAGSLQFTHLAAKVGIGCIQLATDVKQVQGLKIFCDPLADAYIGLGWVSWREPAAMRGRNLPPRKITIPPIAATPSSNQGEMSTSTRM